MTNASPRPFPFTARAYFGFQNALTKKHRHPQMEKGTMWRYETPSHTRSAHQIRDRYSLTAVHKAILSVYKFSRSSQITHTIHFCEHSCTEFNPKGPYIKNTSRISFTPLQKSMAVNKSILTELVNAEWYYVELPYIEFRQNLSKNMECTGTNFFMPSSGQASLGLYSKTCKPNFI